MQTDASPSQASYGRVSLFFFLIVLVLQWGFYKTYTIFFPSFMGFKAVQHFHGAMMMVWMLLLIVQPLLIRVGKISIHRLIGKFSFIIAPIVLISMFLITKFGYYKPVPPLPHIEKIGNLALTAPNWIIFPLFYCLAIMNRRNTYNHMRYMIGTALIMIGPGLGRALIVYYQTPFPVAVTYTQYIEIAIAAALLLNDILKRKSYKATAIILTVFLIHLLLWSFRLYQPWQGIGEFVATYLF